MSSRAKFLAGMARRHVDNDDAMGDSDEEDLSSGEDVVPTNQTTHTGGASATSTSALGRRRLARRSFNKTQDVSKSNQKQQQQGVAPPPPPPPPAAPSQLARTTSSPSPLARRAKTFQHRRMGSLDKVEQQQHHQQVDTSKKQPAAQQQAKPPSSKKVPHHVRSSSYSSTRPSRIGRPMVELPKSFTADGQKSNNKKSGSYSVDGSGSGVSDDISVAASVISAASIQSALTTSTGGGSTSRRHAARRLRKKHSDDWDASTAATEGMSTVPTISYSRSNDSSKQNHEDSASSRSRELDRLKRLSINGMKPKKLSPNNNDAEDTIDGGYEVSIYPNKSNEHLTLSKSDSVESNVSVENKKKHGQQTSRDASVGRGTAAHYREKLGRKRGGSIGRGGQTSSLVARTMSTDSTDTTGTTKNADNEVPMTPTTKRAMFRGRSLSRSRVGGSNVEACATSTTAATARSKPLLPKGSSSKIVKPSSSYKRYNNLTKSNSDSSSSCDNDASSKDECSTLTLAGRRRYRSISRTGGRVDTPQSSTSTVSNTRSNSSPPKSRSRPTLKASSLLASATARAKTPPRPRNPVVPLSPLMKSSHKHHRSWNENSSSKSNSRDKSPMRYTNGTTTSSSSSGVEVNLFDIIKPSKLTSLSRTVLDRAVLPIQTLARSYIAKCTVDRRYDSIIVVQSAMRKWRYRRYYTSAQKVALVCQSSFRGVRARDQLEFQHYCATRIQAAMRGFIDFLTFMEGLSRILLLQSIWRMQSQRKKFRAQLEFIKNNDAAVKVQTSFRRFIAMDEYMLAKSDVVVCQSAIRRMLAMKQTMKLRQVRSATKIQACWRRHLAVEYFIFMLSDVIVCQSVIRRRIATRKYKASVEGAVIIQKMCRGYIERIYYQEDVADVVTCQAVVRRWSAVRQLQALKQLKWAQEFVEKENAATKIRGAFLGYSERMNYLITVSNIITCQSMVRKWSATREVQVLRHDKREWAATKMRAVFLGYQARIEYFITVSDVITIQSAARKMIARNDFLARLQAKKENAATKIRAAFLGYQARIEYFITISDAIRIQSVARKMIARKEFLARLQAKEAMEYAASTKIRSAWLGYIERMNFIITVSSVITCQSFVRTLLAKKEFNVLRQIQRAKEDAAATKISSAYIGYITRMDYIVTVSSAITCQSIVRQLIARKELEALRYAKHERASITIQKTYKSYTARLNYMFTVADIITIQKSVRGHQARVLVGEMKQMMKEERAAIMIQKTYRGFVAFEEHVLNLASTIFCQAAIRQYLAKKELARRKHLREANEKATRIQTCWRAYKAQTDYAVVMYGVISLQAQARCCFQKRRYQEYQWKTVNANATKIQACWRACKARTDYAIAIWGFISLQSLVRCRLQRRKYQEYQWKTLNHNTTKIQTCWRAYKGQTDWALALWGTIQLQSIVRTRLTVKKYHRVKSRRIKAVVAIQTAFRSHAAYNDYITKLVSTITIQTYARMWAAMRATKVEAQRRNSAIKLQSIIRRHLVIQQVNKLREYFAVLGAERTMRLETHSSTVIQTWWRHTIYQRKLARDATFRERVILENAAATAIQSCYRGYRDFVSYVVKSFSMVQLQACVRRHQAQRLLKRLAQEREEELEQEYLLQNAAATAIQSCFRGYSCFARYLMTSFSAIQIQAAVRGQQARCLAKRMTFEKQNEEMVNRAATAIQKCFRGYRDFVHYVVISYHVIQIQTCVRGYHARCQLKKLQRDDRDKSIQRHRRLSDTISKHKMKKHQHSSTSKHSSASKKSIPAMPSKKFIATLPSMKPLLTKREAQKQREKNAALVIERFFIKIKAEIELEMSRLEQKSLESKNKRKGSSKKVGAQSVSSAFSFKENKASHASQHRGQPTRAAYSNKNIGPARPESPPQVRRQPMQLHPQQNAVRNSSTSKGHMPSIQSSNSIRSGSPSRGRNPTMQQIAAIKNTPGGRGRMPSIQSVSAIGNASPARGRIPSAQSANTITNAPQSRGRGLQRAPSTEHMPQHGGSMRAPSPARQGMSQYHHNAMRAASPSRMSHTMRSASPSRMSNMMRSASPSRGPMPMANASPMHARAPPPNYGPQTQCNQYPQQTPSSQLSSGLQSNSFASASNQSMGNQPVPPNHAQNHHQMHNHPNPTRHQMHHNPPLTSSHQSVSSNGNQAQYQMQNRQMGPPQSCQTPVLSNRHILYQQKSYNRN